MKNILKIFRADAKRLSTNVVAVVVIMGLSIIPSLYAWFNIFSNWNPYGAESTSNLKIAVFSNDTGGDFGGVSFNIGSNVIDGLKENNSIGWVFTNSEEEATYGVYSGAYYAALIMPENFSKDMVSFMNGEVKHPNINYYENDKKNAIAPKITSKAKTSVREEINSKFISTLTETIAKMSNSVTTSGNGSNSIINAMTNQLDGLDSDLQSYITIMDSFINVMNSASGLIGTTKVVIPDLNNLVGSGENAVNSMQEAITSGSGSAQTATDMINYSLSMVKSSLDSISSLVQSSLADIQKDEVLAKANLSNIQAIMPYVEEIFDNSVAAIANIPKVQEQINSIKTQLKTIESDVNAASANVTSDTSNLQNLAKQINDEIETSKSQIKNLEDTFNYSVKPSLNTTINSMYNSLNSVQAILYGVNGDFSSVGEVLDDYSDTLNQGNKSLIDTRDRTVQLKQSLDDMILQLKDINNNQQYKSIEDILKNNPETLGKFIASPIYLDTNKIYPIENYGSAMTPFYTILALWVGALILVAIIHVKVHPVEGIVDVKHYQKYFGRYIIFFTTGQVQTLITVLGNLFYIKIQCHNPFLFWVAASVSSFVFTLFIYSLTVAFGNIGEAIAIVIMVIQVAGAGGTFPVEVLPKIYQVLYKYMPFPYGMNAMRETIAGMYGLEYIKCIGVLIIYIFISLFIGLVVAVHFKKLNKMIEKSKEQTDLML